MPKFNRVSLMGSDELFRPTHVESQPAAAIAALLASPPITACWG